MSPKPAKRATDANWVLSPVPRARIYFLESTQGSLCFTQGFMLSPAPQARWRLQAEWTAWEIWRVGSTWGRAL